MVVRRSRTFFVPLLLGTILASVLPMSTGGLSTARTSVPLILSSHVVTPTPIGGGKGKLAFCDNEGGNFEIFCVDVDGTNERNLSNSPWTDRNPVWSPDGTKLAFISDRDGNEEIYSMNPDGSEQLNLSKTQNDFELALSWSPDATRMVFQNWRAGQHNIYRMNVDGSSRVLLASEGVDCMPAWAPNGQRIAYASGRESVNYKYDIYTMNIDGSRKTRLTTSPWDDQAPNWSPDGRKIVFFSNRDGNFEIYVMDADGSSMTRLTDTSTSQETDPVWSPDGTKIAFLDEYVCIMNADGSERTSLPMRRVYNSGPLSWAP